MHSISVSTCTFPGDFGPKECGTIQQNLKNEILRLAKEDDVLVIINRYPFNLGSNKLWTKEKSGPNQMSKLVEEFNNKGVKIILFAPAPEFSTIQNCIPQPFRLRKNCITPTSKFINQRKTTYQVLDDLQQKGVLIFDPMEHLCRNGSCELFDKESGRLMYPDGSHIARFAAEKYIGKSFINFMARNSLIK